MDMKKLFLIGLASLLLVACGENSNTVNPELQKLKAEKDSIAQLALAKDSTINSFMQSLNEIEDNLGQVKQKQGIISSTAKEGSDLDDAAKDRINEDINFINDLLDENKRKLAQLQKKLKGSDLKVAEFEKMIKKMTRQMEEKDLEINSLKDQLASMNIKITELNTTVEKLEDENEKKTEIIESQITKINTAYYAVGTYKELRDNKVLNKEGGFLGMGKKQILSSDFNQNYFTKIDITKMASIPVNGKNVKLVTNHPSQSFKLNYDGKSTVKSLTINNPEAFWRSSKYLVITLEK